VRILVVGDPYCPSEHFVPAFAALAAKHDVRFVDIEERPAWFRSTPSELTITEYLGTPDQVMAALDRDDVLVVQGAPVTDEVIAASPSLALICSARGGPVNIDVPAATRRGIPVVTTPGKNADAVAELTIALMVTIARRVPDAMRYVQTGAPIYQDNYEGADWFGHDLAGHTLGLVGYGAVGRRVATRARAFAMRVVAHDPYIDASSGMDGIDMCDLPTVLRSADFISIHARLTAENRGLIGTDAFAAMRPGSYFVNTARHELVDEDALIDALASGHLAGAALDVATPSPGAEPHRLLSVPNVLILPHIGGATFETLRRGGSMAVDEIERFAAGQPLLNRANGPELDQASLARTPLR
jgi:D-3-phosphoglycerate dehydrogenase